MALLPRGATHMMQRSPEYRLIYRMWRDLPRDPLVDIASDMLHLPLAELPLLYERWCLLQMIAAVLALPEVRVCSQLLAGAEGGEGGERGGRVALVQDHPLLVLEWRGARLHLRYQPRYAPPAQQRAGGSEHPLPPLCSLDSHTHIPDMALEMVAPDRTPAAVVLDAKYRLKEGGGLPHDALADAYTYLGSIGLPGGVRATRAAALLYPGEGAGEHHASGVAVLPLLPGSTTPLHNLLDTLLSHLLQ
jgi:large subunit ribosomal protein MRP49